MSGIVGVGQVDIRAEAVWTRSWWQDRDRRGDVQPPRSRIGPWRARLLMTRPWRRPSRVVMARLG